EALVAHVRRGGALLGICGGYQMLGRMVEDPHGVESGGAEAGLALLPLRTTLEPAKVTQRVKARLLPDGPDFEAYEIHAGTTRGDSYLNGPGMQNSITELLSTLLREALGKAGLPVPDDVLWEMPREESHGDYATNVALALARPARKAPREIAEAIRKNFPVSP